MKSKLFGVGDKLCFHSDHVQMSIEVDMLEAAGHRVINGVDDAVAINQRAQQINGFGFAAKWIN